MTSKHPNEWVIVGIVAAIQVVNVLDFVMVMPLGPDFARALHIPSASLGLIGGAYTASAAISGLGASFFLDRFDRRPVLSIAMLGLVVGTLTGGFATDLPTLLLARVVAGAFGGPATSIALSIVSDVISNERRGRALGVVMSAFSVASVLGIPAALELARLASWRAPFIALAALGLVVTALGYLVLPPLRGHLTAGRHDPGWGLFIAPIAVNSLVTTVVLMMAGFVLIPNLSAYLQGNLAFPRDQLGGLYLLGGLVSLVSMQGSGFLVDRFGSFLVSTAGSIVFVAAVWAGFVIFPPLVSAYAIFPLFMVANGLRNVAFSALTSKVPAPAERARFTSIQSCLQHLASAGGAFLASAMLSEGPNNTLVGMQSVALVSIALTATVPPLVFFLERRVKAKLAAATAPT